MYYEIRYDKHMTGNLWKITSITSSTFYQDDFLNQVKIINDRQSEKGF